MSEVEVLPPAIKYRIEPMAGYPSLRHVVDRWGRELHWGDEGQCRHWIDMQTERDAVKHKERQAMRVEFNNTSAKALMAAILLIAGSVILDLLPLDLPLTLEILVALALVSGVGILAFLAYLWARLHLGE